MRIFRIGAAVAAAVVLVGASQVQGVDRASAGPAAGPGGPTGFSPEAPQGGDTVFCDNTAMIAGGTYTEGNGNAIAGQVPFLGIFDLQTADDCVLTSPAVITRVCGGFLTFAGTPPATGVWVQVYADVGGAPANVASFNQTATGADVTSTPFIDTVFLLQGQYICADLTAFTFSVPAGTWWFDIQPIDITAGGDWFYQVRDTVAPVTGGEAHAKDGATEHGGAFGGPYPGGHGSPTWFPFSSQQGGAPGDNATLVQGIPEGGPGVLEVPAVGRTGLAVLALVIGAAALVLVRRRG